MILLMRVVHARSSCELSRVTFTLASLEFSLFTEQTE